MFQESLKRNKKIHVLLREVISSATVDNLTIKLVLIFNHLRAMLSTQNQQF